MFFIYILYSGSADRFYIGQTSDVERRLHEHNHPLKNSKFTSKYIPWELMLSFPVSEERAAAMKMEKFIKSQKSRSFIQKLIQNKENSMFFDQLTEDIL